MRTKIWKIIFGCFLIGSSHVTYSQVSSLIDSLWNNEEFDKIITQYENEDAIFSERDSAIVAKTYTAQQQNEKALSLSRLLYKNHPNKISYLLQILAAATQLKDNLLVYSYSLNALDKGVRHKSVYRYALSALNKMDNEEALWKITDEGWHLYPQDPVITLNYASLLQEKKLYDSSLNVILPVLAKDSSQYSLLEKAIKAYYIKNDFGNAVQLANFPLTKNILSQIFCCISCTAITKPNSIRMRCS